MTITERKIHVGIKREIIGRLESALEEPEIELIAGRPTRVTTFNFYDESGKNSFRFYGNDLPDNINPGSNFVLTEITERPPIPKTQYLTIFASSEDLQNGSKPHVEYVFQNPEFKHDPVWGAS